MHTSGGNPGDASRVLLISRLLSIVSKTVNPAIPIHAGWTPLVWPYNVAMRRDLTAAIRSLRAAPAFVVVVVTVLGLGIGANIAMFSVFNAVLLRPLNYPDADGLYHL